MSESKAKHETLRELAAATLVHTKAIVSAHTVPDPDALGSAIAIARGLLGLGVDAEIYFGDELPSSLHSLVADTPVCEVLPSAIPPLFFVVDTASEKRIAAEGKDLLPHATTVVNLDHHYSNTIWGTDNFIDASAAASAEIALNFLKEINAPIDAVSATALYAGVLDDTGCFRFSNTSPASLRAAAELVERGANPSQIAELLYFTQSMRSAKLRGRALEALQLVGNAQVSLIQLSQKDFAELGATADDAEGIVDEARAIEGVRVAVLIRELPKDGWKVSLRGKDESINVGEVASKFGGGGHTGAAGCRVEGDASEARMKVLTEVFQALAIDD